VSEPGKAVGRFEAALGVVGLLALGSTYALITGWNPLPAVQAWIDRSSTLSDPETSWVVRVGGQPNAAVVASGAVVVTMRGAIEARRLSTGEVAWQREADWAGVAGEDSAAVAIVGRRSSGLEAVDPVTGVTRWKDGDAIGAWTYRDAVLTLSCKMLSDCTLASRAPGDGGARWKTVLPGVGRVHSGVNSELLDSREMSSTFEDVIAAAPESIPAVLGFPIDQRVQTVESATGKRLRQESPNDRTRVVVVAGRVLVSTVVPRDGTCRYSLEARDAASGKAVWRKDGYDLRTASGAGCEQRRDPAGSGGILAATRGDNREVFLAARDGREVYIAAVGEKIVATDGRFGVVRTADGTTLRAVNLATGGKAWEQAAPAKAAVAVTRWAVFVSDFAEGRLRAYEPASGRRVVDVKTGSEVLGFGPTGVVIARGRTIGFLPYGTVLASGR
jgi:outer membrane protein assembly factor BamB